MFGALAKYKNGYHQTYTKNRIVRRFSCLSNYNSLFKEC